MWVLFATKWFVNFIRRGEHHPLDYQPEINFLHCLMVDPLSIAWDSVPNLRPCFCAVVLRRAGSRGQPSAPQAEIIMLVKIGLNGGSVPILFLMSGLHECCHTKFNSVTTKTQAPQ